MSADTMRDNDMTLFLRNKVVVKDSRDSGSWFGILIPESCQKEKYRLTEENGAFGSVSSQ